MSTRQTPTSKRSPSILVTDVRNAPSGGRSAPFVKLKNVSVDALLSGVSEVPSAQDRGLRRPINARGIKTQRGQRQPPVGPPRALPRLTQSIPSRSSKNSQRLVLIPSQDGFQEGVPIVEGAMAPLMGPSLTEVEQLPRDKREGMFPRVTSYFLGEAFRLKQVADYTRHQHKARTRLYDEALFVDYLLPLLPGNGTTSRVQSSLGDNRTMERMIDISEQGDHHYEYFSGLEAHNDNRTTSQDSEDFDPSEPQDFSPRPSATEHIPSQSPPTANMNGSPGTEEHAQSEEHSKARIQTRIDDIQKYLSHAEMFVLNYGVVVFWNFTEAQEKAIIADLTLGHRELVVKPYPDNIEIEEFNFRYSDEESGRPRIFNDMITLTSPSHMVKLSMSHAIAQSTKLSRFEDRMQSTMKDVKYVPKTLALTGELGLKRPQVLQISGRLFKLRVDVNLSSNILDTPEFFWESEPSLHPLYSGVREYLEIDQRILVLNERCLVFLDFTGILADSIAEGNMVRITVIVIALIVLSIIVSLSEIAIRFLVLRKLRH